MDDHELRSLLEHATAEAQTATLLAGLTLLALLEKRVLGAQTLDDITDAALLMTEEQVERQAFAAERTLARLQSVRALLEGHESMRKFRAGGS